MTSQEDMTSPTGTAYSWHRCELRCEDSDLEEVMSSQMMTLTDPWQGLVSGAPCFRIWRINHHCCTMLPDELFGEFYTHDVYLVLNQNVKVVNPKRLAMERHLHVWVGKMATELAYRVGLTWCSRLDKLLNKDCLLYREVQGMESLQFVSYFNPITYHAGGFSDGYWMCRVRGDYQPARMLKLYKPDRSKNQLVALEVPCRVSELDPAFTFVLDIGHKLFIWHGNLTPTAEDLQCTEYVERVKANRGAETEVEALDDDTERDAHEFFTYLSRDTYMDDRGAEQSEHESSSLHRSATLRRNKQMTGNTQLFKISLNQKKLPHVDFVKKREENKDKGAKIHRSDVDKSPISLVNSVQSSVVVLDKKSSKTTDALHAFKIGHEFMPTCQNPLKPLLILRYKQSSPLLSEVLT